MYQPVQGQPMMQQQPMMMQQQQPGMMMQQQPQMMQQQPQMMQQQPQMMQQQMMQQVPGQPIMVVQQGNPYSYMTALDKLKNIHGVFIKQKPQFMEAFTGCEMNNTYNVFACDKDGEKKKKLKLFKCKEKSSCLSKQCLQADARPFTMNVQHESKGGEGNDDMPAFFFEREYQCTVCCFNRPEMTLFLAEGGQRTYLGKIRNPWKCMDLEMEIYDNNNDVIYILTGSVCQMGMCCPTCPCDACQTVDFEIRDRHKNKIGTFQKRNAGCMKSALTDADNFSMIFPSDATAEHRALLMGSLILLDFTYFEEKGSKQQGGEF